LKAYLKQGTILKVFLKYVIKINKNELSSMRNKEADQPTFRGSAVAMAWNFGNGPIQRRTTSCRLRTGLQMNLGSSGAPTQTVRAKSCKTRPGKQNQRRNRA